MAALFPGLSAKPASPANRGLAFEQRIAAQHRRYRAQGWICLRQHLPSIPVGDGMARITGRAAPDWLVGRGGQLFLIELKSTEAQTWPMADLLPHQAGWLDRAAAVGWGSGVVLACAGVVWWLPWSELGPRWWRWHRQEAERGDGSLSQDALFEVGDRCEGADWLPVALR